LQVESTFEANSTFREVVEETDPFGEKYSQTRPFTPFKINVSLLDLAPSDKFYWAEVRRPMISQTFNKHSLCSVLSSFIFTAPDFF